MWVLYTGYIFKIYHLLHLFYKNLSYAIKQKNLEKAAFPIAFQARKVLVMKWHLPENLTFQNLLKNRKLIPAEKFWNTLAFDKERKRKLHKLLYQQRFVLKK